MHHPRAQLVRVMDEDAEAGQLADEPLEHLHRLDLGGRVQVVDGLAVVDVQWPHFDFIVC